MKEHLIGYARVSTPKQSMEIQIQQLRQFAENKGCSIEIYSEKHSGKEYKEEQRESLANALKRAKETSSPIVVTYLDRISRNVKDGMYIWDNYEVVAIHEIIKDRKSALEAFKRAEDEFMKISIKSKLALDAMRGRTPEFIYEFYADLFYIWYYANIYSLRFKQLYQEIQGIIVMDAIINCDPRRIDEKFIMDEHFNPQYQFAPKETCDETVKYICESLMLDEEYIEDVFRRRREKDHNEGWVLPKMFKSTMKEELKLRNSIERKEWGKRHLATI